MNKYTTYISRYLSRTLTSDTKRNMDRAKVLFGHLGTSNNVGTIESYSSAASTEADDDILVCSALRTPIGKAGRGSLKDTFLDDMLGAVYKAVLDETKLDPGHIGDMCVGNVMLQGSGASLGRVAQFYVGIPEEVPIMAVNRQCASGLQAVMSVAGSIKTGVCEIGLAAGAEKLTGSSFGAPRAERMGDVNPKIFTNNKAQDTLLPMGITSENVAERYGISRELQDQMAVESHAKAHRAQQYGWFDAEIVPITTVVKDKDGKEKKITMTKDDGVRPNTTLAGLAKLKPVFKKGGSTTAGNASQVSDGAAAVLLATRSAARRQNLPVLGVLRSYAVVGVPPDVMGIGPAFAIPHALNKAGLTVEDVDIFEINEAFASQATYCIHKLGIPREKLNPKGGAIAFGHPLGMTGARMVATLLHELKRRGKRSYGVVSMCMGTGMGAAAVFEYPGPI
ncbi:unnamed protein product [Owenia fusiformis]|uniref:Uncharacterized protein n=1 Tax=Owenia fusiformis TaxID=6347 RepID=A0A8J1UK34_OWEFU|nr:unnamed protein product [Owenia fusiformis]